MVVLTTGQVIVAQTDARQRSHIILLINEEIHE
jgi:hypothetical protein